MNPHISMAPDSFLLGYDENEEHLFIPVANPTTFDTLSFENLTYLSDDKSNPNDTAEDRSKEFSSSAEGEIFPGFNAVSPDTDCSKSECDFDQCSFHHYDVQSLEHVSNKCTRKSNYNVLKPFATYDTHTSDVLSNYDSDNREVSQSIAHQKKDSSKLGTRNHWGDSSSKNAIAARDNRLKKKQYVSGLEESIKLLQNENNQLSEENKRNKKMMQSLKKEVIYLRSIIANQTTLAAILKNVAQTPGIRLSSSVASLKSVNKPGLISQTENEIASSKLNKKYDSVQLSSRNLMSTNKQCLIGKSPKACKRPCTETETIMSGSSSKTKKTKLSNLNESEQFVNVEDTDSDRSSEEEYLSGIKNEAGICLHVSGNSVSLELCSKYVTCVIYFEIDVQVLLFSQPVVISQFVQDLGNIFMLRS
ncbi:hypothetical protein Btru_001696 [Bulinus truncatus]|nr:hypothetical protein Btru_001696 [Bulinus truncatus]